MWQHHCLIHVMKMEARARPSASAAAAAENGRPGRPSVLGPVRASAASLAAASLASLFSGPRAPAREERILGDLAPSGLFRAPDGPNRLRLA
jgi:hypothetical protein